MFFPEMLLVHQNQIAELILVFDYLRVQYRIGGFILLCGAFPS